MKVGLVGVGRIGALHAGTLGDLPGIDTVLVADADPGRAKVCADRFGLTPAGSIDDLFAARPDGVVIAAPTAAHAELVGRAARAGVAVFCEKPLAPDAAGTRAVLAEVEAAGVPLQVGFQRRFDPGYQAARERLRSGELGRLYSVWACTLDPAPPPAAYLPTSGGIFRDCGVHDFDAVRWVTGAEVVEVHATGANRGADFFAAAGDVDTGHALLTLDDGTLVSVAVSRYNGAGYDVRLELHGSLGTAVAGLDHRAPLTSTEPAEPAEPGTHQTDTPAYANFAERFAAAYVAELAAFADVAAGRIPSPCGGADALEAFHVADAAELSRRENRPVRIEEVRR
ncbi:myo-inositol 2-dehydrogenase / D-chiro-inositol 1-dehydrogenase [Actinopolymorpha cephalotaxi]|uniref:Myo-inositol 2-dehydrogenase / D-chiro-inositol 1-dehydrogenase n=1 Tax=Actinopolymorpha cephalotaxi TaxID=504797 RepID=A0A1I2WEA6_9ACTN|nr:Gfo/Idh/MocA family oxidoreductase [Actinopolymorpha cephalotaxi]NYH82620.1 myo-inositol 2-dehydrogenase/D-chiro-inositol 1-dehydrogenase [Actinopolymorpha cephalotaxi]SFG99632.1 myo-inositol 2-dehydrogenase / D-chiro-inositol 1-dehydrogenase [Actinopolymorpha cephalotaxi]